MKGITIESISECLSTLASLSALAIPQNPALVDFLLRVMVTSIVLFDQVNPVGAFAKGSGINVSPFVIFIIILIVTCNLLDSRVG